MQLAYYNEIDGFVAHWLRNLIAEGLIAPGDVDTRDIREVQPDDIRGYTQAHFFAGIAGWPLALRLAGWPDDRPVWTGSCPCQPFSSAGKRRGVKDVRHLWPEFHRLIAQCRPARVFGEQVASKDGLGWIDGVFADLENAGYACGAADLCAAGVNAPHIRQRLFWVADAQGPRCTRREHTPTPREEEVTRPRVLGTRGHGEDAAGLAHPQLQRARTGGRAIESDAAEDGRDRHAVNGDDSRRLAHPDGAVVRREPPTGQQPLNECNGRDRAGVLGQLDHTSGAGPQRHSGHGGESDQPGRLYPMPFGSAAETGACDGGMEHPTGDGRDQGLAGADGGGVACRCGCCDEVLPYHDGKGGIVYRRSQSGAFPLAHGLPRSVGPGSTKEQRVELMAAKNNRVGRLKGYGNAIRPDLAARFIEVSEEVLLN